MKKPWVVGLLSIVPGLGLIVLGKVVAGHGVLGGMALLVFLSMITTSEEVTAWLFSLALILWMLQLGWAVVAAWVARLPQKSPEKTARRKAREPQREATAIQRSAREALTPLLVPGQHLRMALAGSKRGVDARVLGEILLAILHALGGGAYAGGVSDPPTTCIGITEDELVFAITRRPPRPSDLRRVPLGNVSLVEFKEGRWGFDKLVLHIGERKPLRLVTAESLRPVIQELAAILAIRSQELDMTDSAGHLQGTLDQQAPPLPLHVRLFRLLGPAPRDIAATLRANGPARASLRASLYSVALFAVSIAATVLATLGPMALAAIFPTGLLARLQDVVLFILLLPALLATLLGIAAGLVAAGLAIYSIFTRGERPLTVTPALLAAAALVICYAFVTLLLLGGE
jgi:hypothetical protein